MMKRVIKRLQVIVILCTLASSFAVAQNQSIHFEETTSWNKIVKRALEEKRLIFVDCYADWCGPCKKLASEVFTQDKVAEFFNSNFINASYNVEKSEDAKRLAQVWQVSALPTLMFIDPETEQPVHKLVGSGDAEWLIAGAKQALDPEKRLDAMLSRYNNGDRDPAFMIRLVKALSTAGMAQELEKITKEFLSGLNIDQLATPVVWSLIVQYENDPLSKTLLTVRDNAERFYALPGQNQKQLVQTKLASAILDKAMQYSMNPNLAVYDKEAYDAFVDYLVTAEEPGKSMAAVWLNTSMLSRQGDWKKMLEVMRAVKDEQILPPQVYGKYFLFYMQSLAKMEDKSAVDGGVKWIEELIAEAVGEDISTYYIRTTLYGAEAGLYEAAERYGKAQKAKKEMEKYVNLIKEATASNQ
ncbi:thioredoxin family protein [Plebeiibacterium sediminum]|uniref:Thioredoxin domain-containing protein n=1 Tax=Plebeiibacterium sediminum TaxID=2992112 RepID=A0AAE3M414_9BACT|nr:thioredoxin domain-containing protein [Plebeiobacterium sediminum]MCW3786817.1 thioredoxin domain-containing protein [Plebeiobacterium sediminum]